MDEVVILPFDASNKLLEVLEVNYLSLFLFSLGTGVNIFGYSYFTNGEVGLLTNLDADELSFNVF